jgi:hypothetical protein
MATLTRRLREWGRAVRARLRAAREVYEGVYMSPYRSVIHREYTRFSSTRWNSIPSSSSNSTSGISDLGCRMRRKVGSDAADGERAVGGVERSVEDRWKPRDS